MILISFFLPVPPTTAVTFKMPSWSISKVTSIFDSPAGAGGISVEFTQQLVVLGHLVFTLEHLKQNGGLRMFRTLLYARMES